MHKLELNRPISLRNNHFCIDVEENKKRLTIERLPADSLIVVIVHDKLVFQDVICQQNKLYSHLKCFKRNTHPKEAGVFTSKDYVG